MTVRLHEIAPVGVDGTYGTVADGGRIVSVWPPSGWNGFVRRGMVLLVRPGVMYAAGHDDRIPFAGKLRLIGGERYADADGVSCLGPLAAWCSDIIAIIG